MQWRRRMALPGQCIFLMQEDPLTTASVVQFFRLRILCLCALDLQALRRSGLPFPGALLRNLDIKIPSGSAYQIHFAAPVRHGWQEAARFVARFMPSITTRSAEC